MGWFEVFASRSSMEFNAFSGVLEQNNSADLKVVKTMGSLMHNSTVMYHLL